MESFNPKRPEQSNTVKRGLIKTIPLIELETRELIYDINIPNRIFPVLFAFHDNEYSPVTFNMCTEDFDGHPLRKMTVKYDNKIFKVMGQQSWSVERPKNVKGDKFHTNFLVLKKLADCDKLPFTE